MTAGKILYLVYAVARPIVCFLSQNGLVAYHVNS